MNDNYQSRESNENNEKEGKMDNKDKAFGNDSGGRSEKRLVIIGQTEESIVNTGFRKVSPNHSNWGRDLYSDIVWNKTVYCEMKLIA